MIEEQKPRPAAGLSIEPDLERPQHLVLKLGTSRFECILDLDHPDFAINGGSLGPRYTLDCWMAELDRLAGGGGRGRPRR